VVTSLEEVDLVGADQVDDPVFLGEAAGPGARREILEWFGFADATDGVAQDRLNDGEGPEGDLPAGFDPEPEVLQELELEYGDPFGRASDT
jgi:hypothetical protein